VRFTSHNSLVAGQPYSNGPVEFELAIDAMAGTRVRSIAVSFYDDLGRLLVNADIGEFGAVLDLPPGRTTLRLRIERLHLKPGSYSLGLWMARHAADDVSGADIIDFVEKAMEVEVTHAEADRIRNQRWNGVVPCEFKLLDVSHADRLRESFEPLTTR
jgi:lipopolysaccharide transport system ATP-binding protein